MSTVGLRIGPADHGRKMSMDEFLEAEEQPGYSYELARGVLEVVQVPGDAHWQVVYNVQKAFSGWDRRNPGSILRMGGSGEVRLLIPELESDRHPDVAIVFRNSPKDARGRRTPGLVVEVVSPGAEARRRDYEEKREEYLTLGIPEYWIVDPQLRQVTVLVRRGGPNPAWTERVFRDTETIAGEALPGFTGTVAELWADLDESEPGA